MIGLCYVSLRCFISSFVEIGPQVPGENILKCFTIYWHGSHIGYVTIIILINFHFLVSKKWFLRKASFNFDIKMALGQGKNDIHLEHSHIFI